MPSRFKTIQRYKFLATHFSTVLVIALPMAEIVVRAQLALCWAFAHIPFPCSSVTGVLQVFLLKKATFVPQTAMPLSLRLTLRSWMFDNIFNVVYFNIFPVIHSQNNDWKKTIRDLFPCGYIELPYFGGSSSLLALYAIVIST